MSALPSHTTDIASGDGCGRCLAVPVWISAVPNGWRVFLLPPFAMSYSLTVREKEHWKDRIAARIDKRIDALNAENGKIMEQVNKAARERALDSLGIGTLHKRAEHLKQQKSSLEEKESKTYREIAAKLRGISVREVTDSRYGIQSEISEAVAERQTLHEDELLAESEAGREILSLRSEKENLLDTVWLATSGKQIKDLWEKVDSILGNTQTELQRKAMEIPPVEED